MCRGGEGSRVDSGIWWPQQRGGGVRCDRQLGLVIFIAPTGLSPLGSPVSGERGPGTQEREIHRQSGAFT